jgi:hypothetical protein
LGAVCLAACGLLAAGLAWPSPRGRVDLAWSSEQVQSAWISLQSESAWTDVAPAPGLTVAIDAPALALEGRRERLELSVRVAPDSRVFPIYTLAAEVVSADVLVDPAGESGQALRPATAFAWSLFALHVPESSATILIRLRRHAAGGVAEAERLLLARELVLPVRTLAGLSAPGATWAAAILGLAGAMLWVAATLPRTR